MYALGSILVWEAGVAPVVSWLLRYLVTPCFGTLAGAAAELLLRLVYRLVWLLPVYLVAMLVSCGMWVVVRGDGGCEQTG